MSFKLLAIRPLEGCSDDIRKNLKVGQFYFFDNAYEQYKDTDYIRKKESGLGLPNDFFFQKNTESSLEYVNVQAIVGMNGSGKSSVVEFLLRTLNNIYKYCQFYTSDFHKLLYINKVVACLYLEYRGKIIKVDLNFNNENYEVNSITETMLHSYFIEHQALKLEINTKNRSIALDLNRDYVRKGIQKFFYTIYLNYSLYGLDELDFVKEAYEDVKKEGLNEKGIYKRSWLNKIFHKNDGYRTPMVIHPYREDAMINVRNEKVLMAQRLSVLLFTNPEYRDAISNFYFNEIEFSLKPFKFQEYFYFLNYKQKNIKEDIVNVSISSIFVNDELIINQLIEEKIDYLKDFLLKEVEIIERIENDFETSYVNSPTFLQHWLLSLDEFIKTGEHTKYELSSIFKSYRDDVDKFNDKVKDVSLYEDKQAFRVVYESTLKITYSTLISLIKVYVIKDLLVSYLKIDKNSVSYDDKNINIIDYLFWYCVIKVVNIIKYDTHSDLNKMMDPMQLLFIPIEELKKSFIGYFNYIVKRDRSHKTDKLRRTLFLLKDILLVRKGNMLQDELSVYYDNLLKDILESGNRISRPIEEIGNLVANKMNLVSNRNIEIIDLLPPSIFEYEFYDKNNSQSSLSKVSSGQFQKLGLLSSIIYHLKNLDSIQEIKNIYSYKNVNLILDEIELYFHPDQQRTFVNDLLCLLKKNKFKQIKNINLMFITHSPFILSDIPSQNVLKLKEGKPVKGDEINSFGANIHDLLADKFFLENGFMGEFAKGKISSVVDFLAVSLLASKEKRSKEEEEKINNIKSKAGYVEYTRDNCKLIIDSIGEPILRYNIEELYQQFLLIEDDKEDSIKKEIARLEATLQELRRKGGEKR